MRKQCFAIISGKHSDDECQFDRNAKTHTKIKTQNKTTEIFIYLLFARIQSSHILAFYLFVICLLSLTSQFCRSVLASANIICNFFFSVFVQSLQTPVQEETQKNFVILNAPNVFYYDNN